MHRQTFFTTYELFKLFSLCAMFRKTCCPSMVQPTLYTAHIAQVYVNDQACEETPSDVIAIKANRQQYYQLMSNCAGGRTAAVSSQAWRCYWATLGTALQVNSSSNVHYNTVFFTLQHCCTDHHAGIKQRPQHHCVLLNVQMLLRSVVSVVQHLQPLMLTMLFCNILFQAFQLDDVRSCPRELLFAVCL